MTVCGGSSSTQRCLLQVQLGVECTYERCVLRGDEVAHCRSACVCAHALSPLQVSEIKVVLKEVLADAVPPGEDD
jgi:hypothetical protein